MKLSHFVVILSAIIANPLMAMSQNYVVLSHKEYVPHSMKLKISDIAPSAPLNPFDKKFIKQQPEKNFGVIYDIALKDMAATLNEPTDTKAHTEIYLENNTANQTIFDIYTKICPLGISEVDNCVQSIDTIELKPYAVIQYDKSFTVEFTFTNPWHGQSFAFVAASNVAFNYYSIAKTQALVDVH